VAAIGLLALLASLALQALSDEARLRAIVHDKVQQSWGRDVQIKSLRWQLLPSPRLHAHGVVVANAAWAQGRHLLEIEDISARLAPWPLLNGKAVIRRLDFDGVTVNLEAAPDGRRNWDAVEKTGAGVHAQWRQQLAELTDLRITNGHILYRDGAQKAAAWELRKFRADTDRGLRKLSFNMALERDGHPLQLSGNFDDLSQLGMAGARTKGQLSAHSGEAAVTLEGMLPLSSDAPFDLRVALDARSLKEAFGFFHLEHGLPAVVQASAELHGTVQGVTVSNAQVQLGRSTVSGKGAWRRGSKPAFDAQLHADYIDMEQTFLDAGLPPLPPKPEGELFHDSPLPWPLLVALDGTQGKAELQVDQLRLRSNVTVRQAAAAMRFDGDRMSVTHFRGDLLGGSAEGDAVLEGRRQAVQLNLRLHGTQLGAWFRESGRKLDISGGTMEVDARLSTSGRSMKALAAGISGPTNIRIGPAKILSEKAGRAEFWMNGLFSARDANRIDLSCASLRLPFKSGVAQGDGIAGARSEASQLLSSGRVDMRREEVDLRGRLRARSGVHLGISSFAGDIKIVGKIAKPQWSLDETNVGSVLARIGAAILTSGVSIVATAIWDGANPASDPCQLVFSRSRAAKK
jgi:hypothetical protein